MTFIIRGRINEVAEAKRELWAEIAQLMTSPVEVPAEHLGSVIGANGKILQAIMAETGTKINTGRKGEQYTGYILVTGDYDGVTAAKARIRSIVEEKEKKVVQKIEVKAHLLPFVYGVPSSKVGEQAGGWSEKYSIRMSQDINRDTDEAIVTFSGDRDEVRVAVSEFTRLVDEQRRTVRSVSTTIPKALHKFIIGPKGATLHEIELETGCSIVVPIPENPSDQIMVLGPQEKLFKGLSAVMDKTSSVASETIKVPLNVRTVVFERFRNRLNDIQTTRNISVSWCDAGIQLSGFKNQVAAAYPEIEVICTPLVYLILRRFILNSSFLVEVEI